MECGRHSLCSTDPLVACSNPNDHQLPTDGLRGGSQALLLVVGLVTTHIKSALGLSATGGKESNMIQVRLTAERDPFLFDVVVSEGKGETRHHVTMSREMCERLTAGKHTPERCLEAAFRFLLDREPKESILRRFDVTEISRYFPEFEREMPHYLSQL